MIVRPLIFSSFGVDDDVLNYVGLVVFVESFRFGMDVISNFVIIFMVGALADQVVNSNCVSVNVDRFISYYLSVLWVLDEQAFYPAIILIIITEGSVNAFLVDFRQDCKR